VTPADLTRELLLGQDWTDLTPRRVRIAEFDAETGAVSLEVYASGRRATPVRRLLLEGGPNWRVVLEQRLDPGSGRVIAETTRDDYVQMAGVVFPRQIETHFPGHDAWMRLEVRRLDASAAFDPEVFDVGAALRDAQRRGYAFVETLE